MARRAEPASRARRRVTTTDSPPFARIYGIVRAIPRGRVATYGQVARLAGLPQGARTVGWALRALNARTEPHVPWHRVVAADGVISLPDGRGGELQRARLRAEGVRFRRGRVDLERHGVVSTSSPSLDTSPDVGEAHDPLARPVGLVEH